MWLPVPARARIGCVSLDLSFLREGQALGTHSTSFNYLAETLQDSSDYRQERGAAHSLFFPEKMITRSLRRAAKLRPSPASIFSIDLHLLHTNTTYRREQDPGRRGGWGERSTWASARGACAVLPGFALGVPAVGTWPPSEKPPTYLLTPGKAQ